LTSAIAEGGEGGRGGEQYAVRGFSTEQLGSHACTHPTTHTHTHTPHTHTGIKIDEERCASERRDAQAGSERGTPPAHTYMRFAV
jgi:hypothetical protein